MQPDPNHKTASWVPFFNACTRILFRGHIRCAEQYLSKFPKEQNPADPNEALARIATLNFSEIGGLDLQFRVLIDTKAIAWEPKCGPVFLATLITVDGGFQAQSPPFVVYFAPRIAQLPLQALHPSEPLVQVDLMAGETIINHQWAHSPFGHPKGSHTDSNFYPEITQMFVGSQTLTKSELRALRRDIARRFHPDNGNLEDAPSRAAAMAQANAHIDTLLKQHRHDEH